jgi:CHAT domain-containing protein
MVEIRDGNPAAALEYLQSARVLYSAIASPGGEESVLGQMGSAFETMGELQKGIAYMDSAVSVAKAHQLVREESEDLQIYAEVLGEAGDYQAALRHLARARSLAELAGLESRMGDLALAQARALAAISRNDLALGRAREAAAIHEKAGAKFEEMQDHLLIAEIAQAVGHNNESSGELERAGEIARTLALPVAAENVALGTARVADLSRDAAAVLRALPGELTFQRMGLQSEAEAEALRARAFARLRQWPEAASAGKRAVSSLETIRDRLGEGPLRAAFTSDRARVYADLVIALLQLGRTSDAFEVADAARGRALLEHLSVIRGNVRATAGDLVEADRLLRRIDYLTERLRVADTVRSPVRVVAMRKDLQDLSARLASARKEYEDRMTTVARTDPRGATLLGFANMRFRDVQKSLGPSELLLEYLAADNQLLIFAATRDTVVATSSKVSLDDLANRARLASDLLRKSTTASSGREVLRGLYDVLIAPVETKGVVKEGSSFVVIPHSALSYLPFAALVAPDGRRLVEMHSVLELPSAATLPFLRSAEQPTVPSTSAVFAPFPAELAGTAEEASVVRRAAREAVSFVGGRASEAQLRQALAGSSVVHVASHAILDQANPMFSHIELAAAPKRTPADDGSLEVHEILGMPVHSQLVYLSGCETGVGAAWSTAFRRSQDYATLSQAMLFAGAQNVVATLWRIDDSGASVFARRFYGALATHDVTDALAIAQREMIRDSRYSAPRYWAGYTISGAGKFSPVLKFERVVSVKP